MTRCLIYTNCTFFCVKITSFSVLKSNIFKWLRSDGAWLWINLALSFILFFRVTFAYRNDSSMTWIETLFFRLFRYWDKKIQKIRVFVKFKSIKNIILLNWVFFDRSSGILLLHLSVQLCTAIILINVNICTLDVTVKICISHIKRGNRNVSTFSFSCCVLFCYRSRSCGNYLVKPRW